jgi:uncharacterized protein YjbI with pentapeptide repeats
VVLAIVFVGVCTILGAMAFAVRNARQNGERRNADALPLVTIMIVFGIFVLVIALQLAVEPGKDLKTVLTTAVVGSAVITANFGLWLNHRRYRLEEARQLVERDKADLDQRRHRLEQEKIELEHTKDRREHDKVADDLLVRVVELFGHADARVRGGALHVLAALAAQRPERAQDVVRLVCMYLRTTPADDSVAGEAQTLLLRVVRHAAEDLDVDLTGARLTDFVFENVAVRSLILAKARLTGVTSLRRLGFVGDTLHTGTSHSVLDVDDAEFDGDVWLQGARLRRLSARGTRFLGKLSIAGTWVALEAALSDSFVAADADFAGAEVGKLTCSAAIFDGQTNFRGVIAHSGAMFLQTRFRRVVIEKFVSQHVVLDEAHVEESLRLAPDGGFPSVSLRRMTVSAKVAEDPGLRLPPRWRVTVEDGTRYLVVDQVT